MKKKEFKKLYGELNKTEKERASEEVEIFLETMKQAFSKISKNSF